ncbi:MAG: methylaspartate ammonia-lyase [Actinomycetota bacterium]|nr:methylaspartate ammonia-lyase [Actinomycetota bacterium]
MRIRSVLAEPALSGFYRDDQAAIRKGASRDGLLYVGTPVTQGFSQVREAGAAVTVLLVLEDGQVAVGDCTEVQYSGAGGRAHVFSVEQAMSEVRDHLAPFLAGRTVDQFRALAEEVDRMVVHGRPLLTAVRYGISQALLHAAALAGSITMAELVQQEYATGVALARVPVYAQTGDERRVNVDKMILKEVDVLPHGLINEVDTKLGADGGVLLEYVAWLRGRILAVRRRADYVPRLHIDTYGTIGIAFGDDVPAIADYLGALAAAAAPFRLRIEHPVDAGSRSGQVAAFLALRQALVQRGIDVELVVDEWCNTLDDIDVFVSARAADVVHVKMPDLGGVTNTIEALLAVRRSGLAAYCGGSCNETDVSARVSAHIAMACGADQVLAKPGMGVDEGLMIVANEMTRTLALARSRVPSRPPAPAGATR